MKRFVAIIVLVFCTLTTLSAQDLLVRRDGSQVRVKVLSVSKKRVKYLRYMTDAPVYTVSTSDIDYIEYPDGERDTFGSTSAKAASADNLSKWHGAVKPAVTLDEALSKTDNKGLANAVGEDSALPQYNIGEIYSNGGVAGVVVSTTDEGRHGTVMSFGEACLAWCDLPRRELESCGASDKMDGEANMHAVEQYIATKGLSWSNFPAFEWCRNMGEGWYLPSLNEIWAFGTTYNGGSRVSAKKQIRKIFNEALRSGGGKPLNNLMFYQSSTEAEEARCSCYSHLNGDKPYTDSGSKGDKLFVRAFHKF